VGRERSERPRPFRRTPPRGIEPLGCVTHPYTPPLKGGEELGKGGGEGQTVKLSPQPQAPLALGFTKVKPAVKSSSTQSMCEPIR
jgi:hypothetical protein